MFWNFDWLNYNININVWNNIIVIFYTVYAMRTNDETKDNIMKNYDEILGLILIMQGIKWIINWLKYDMKIGLNNVIQ